MRTLSAREVRWSTAFGGVLVLRLLYPFFNSPLTHIFSDPQRHWDNAALFLHPSVMGSGDPYLYQLWLFVLRQLADDSSAPILTACGALCAAHAVRLVSRTARVHAAPAGAAGRGADRAVAAVHRRLRLFHERDAAA